MEPVLEVIKAFANYDRGLVEAKIKANKVLGILYYKVYSQSYPREYLDKVYQESIFELGYFCGREYIDVPEVYKETFK